MKRIKYLSLFFALVFYSSCESESTERHLDYLEDMIMELEDKISFLESELDDRSSEIEELQMRVDDLETEMMFIGY